jgi:hypothetical protein
MMPRFAALSMAEIKVRISSGFALLPAAVRFCSVRSLLDTLRLRSERFAACRARFAAVFVFAMIEISTGVQAR